MNIRREEGAFGIILRAVLVIIGLIGAVIVVITVLQLDAYSSHHHRIPSETWTWFWVGVGIALAGFGSCFTITSRPDYSGSN